MIALCRHSKYFGNIWLLFGVLLSVCVFVGTPKNRRIFGLLFVLQKNIHIQIKKVVILYAYPCIGPDKSLFWQRKYTKDGCEGKKPLHRRKTIFCVFVYWCIGAKKSQPYTCCTWAGGTFFPVVVLCQFLVLAGNKFWFYILMYLCMGFSQNSLVEYEWIHSGYI
jgi:hypothetical protein